MSYIDFNASANFKDILHLVVEKSNFVKYINKFPFQTQGMKDKSTLSIKYPRSDKIVCVESSNVSYVDNAYFTDHLYEDTNNTSYTNFPVKMTAFFVDWIISD